MWTYRSDEPLQQQFEQVLPAQAIEPMFEPVFFSSAHAGVDGTMEGVDQDESEAHKGQTSIRSLQRQLLPVGASIFIHLLLLMVVRELKTSPDVQPNVFEAPPASIQISFRPRPVPQETPAEEPAEEPAEVPPIAEVPANPTPVIEPVSAEPPIDPVVSPEPPVQAPRLVAPAQLDLRDIIRSHVQSDEISRGYNKIDCDERQRRNDLIDCGEPDPNADYRFAEAESNSTEAFFAELEAPAVNHRTQPRDATNPDTRANVARDNLTGNLGAGPLIRSVMGQP